MVVVALAGDGLRHRLAPIALALATVVVFVGLWMLGWSALDRRTHRLVNESRAQRTTVYRSLRPGGQLLVLGCFVFVVWLTWYALKNVLDTYATRGSLGPSEAPDILVALSGASAIVTAISLAVSRILRTVGVKNKESGAGAESEANGRAAEITAKAEGGSRDHSRQGRPHAG
jgi:TRAP-type C4-dicarboxylate transport system permease small subunit